MAQTLSAADAILKENYTGPIIEQINNKQYIRDRVERVTSFQLVGRRAVIPLHTTRNRGRGSRGAGGTLPTAGSQGYADALVSIRYHYAGIEIEDALVTAATGANAGAFIDALDGEAKGVAQDFRKDICRQIYGEGTGKLATCASCSTATFTVSCKQDLQYLAVGDPVDVVVASTGATSNGVLNTTVSAIDVPNKTFTTADAPVGAGSIDSTYGVYVAGNRNNEMDGLRNIASTGRTLHSINSSTAGNSYWDAQVLSAGSSSTSLSLVGESLIEQLDDSVGAQGGEEIEAFISTRGIVRRLADQYQSQKRFNDAAAVKVFGGYSSITVNGKPVIKDDDCPKTEVFGITPSALAWFEQAAPGWMEQKDASVFHLKDGSTAGTKKAVWQAWWREYSALASRSPQKLGRIKFCLDDTATSG